MSAYVSGRLSKYVVIRVKMLVACPCLFLVFLSRASDLGSSWDALSAESSDEWDNPGQPDTATSPLGVALGGSRSASPGWPDGAWGGLRGDLHP